MPFEGGMECQDGIVPERSWDAIAVEGHCGQISDVDSFGQLVDAVLLLEAMQHIKAGTGVVVLPVSLAGFAERKQGCCLGELGERQFGLHGVLTRTFKKSKFRPGSRLLKNRRTPNSHEQGRHYFRIN
jgi:hypothetical protein